MADKQLYDKNASLYVLSTLMREPLLIENDEYVLTKNDFCQPLQQMVYYAIFNLAKQGVSTISPQDIDFYLKQYHQIISLCSPGNTNYNFFTIL